MSDYHFWHLCKRFALATLCAVVMLAALPISAPPAHGAELDRPEELIFEVTMPPYRVSPGVFAYQYKGRFYLPLLELAESYEFFTESDLGRGYVRGWWSEPVNSYSIDMARNELIIRGERFSLSTDDVLEMTDLATDDFYISTDLMSRIWPLDIDVELSTLSVVTEIRGDVVLPFEQRMKRQQRQEAMAYRERRQQPDLPFVPNDYKMFSYPVLDLQGTYEYEHDERMLTGNNTVSGLMHLGGFATDFSGTWRLDRDGRVERPNSIRIHMQREAFGDEDIWGTGLQNIRGGDINMQQRDLVSRSFSGRGLFVSNKKQRETSNEFDRITVEGIGPPGWEIEVYLNNALIEFGEVDASGEYRFEDVVLQYGNNNIRVVLYGPQGQIREDVQNYNISGQQRKPGEFQYDVGFLDADRPLVFLDNEPRTRPRGLAKTANVSYGLSRDVTVFGGLTDIPTDQGKKSYATAGANLSLFNSSLQAEAYSELSGGNALDLRMLTQLFGIRANLRAAFYNDFESPDAGRGQGAKRFEGEAQLSTRVPFFYFGKMGLRVNANHRENVGGTVTSNINTQQTLSKRGLLLTHSTRTSLANEVHTNSSGSFNVNYNIKDWQLRGSMNYLIHPESELSNIQANLRYSDPEDPFQFAVNAQHNFLTTLSGAGVQFGYEFDKILGSLDVNYREQEGFRVIARASSSISPYNADGKYDFSSRQRRREAPVIARVFLDRDADGVYSEGDEPIKDARLLANNRKSLDVSNEEGYVVIKGRTGITNIALDDGSLADPYFRSITKGYSTVPLPGTMPSFEFPVLETGIVEGFVTYLADERPVQGMIIELVDQNGEVVMESETAFDGYYAFEFVLPGSYTVRAHPEYQVNVPPETVTVTSEDLFLYGVDLFLVEQTDEVETAADQNAADGGENRGDVAQASHENGTQSAPTSSGGSDNFAAFVKYVRIGEYPGKGRLVLDLSGPVTYDIKAGADGRSVLIDLPQVGWDPANMPDMSAVSLISGLDVTPMENGTGGGTQLRIATSRPVDVGRHGILPPSEKWNTGHRLYLDMLGGE